MKNILISGYYGSRNSGDEAILTAMLEALREEDDDLHFTVISQNPAYTKKRHNVDSVEYLDIFSTIPKIIAADLLISGGGSLLQNVTSSRSLYYYLGIIFLAKIFGCKIMLYAQGIGPVRGVIANFMMKLILNHVDLITVRDKGSLEELQRLKITRPQIFCTADPVLAFNPVPLDEGKKILSRHLPTKPNSSTPKIGVAVRQCHVGVDNKKIGVAVRRWIDWDNCQRELAAALDKLADELNAEIIFLPMQFPEDVKASESISALMKNPAVVIDEELLTAQMMSLAGCMDVLISIRLHAMIFAEVMDVPIVGISYDPKIDRFLDSIDEKPVATLNDITAQIIFDETLKKLRVNKKFDAVKQNLKYELRMLAVENAQLAISLLEDEG